MRTRSGPAATWLVSSEEIDCTHCPPTPGHVITLIQSTRVEQHLLPRARVNGAIGLTRGMRSFLEGVGVADDPVPQRAGARGRAPGGAAAAGGIGGRHRIGRHRIGRHRIGRHRIGRHRLVDLTVLDLGGGGFCGGRGGSLSSGTNSVSDGCRGLAGPGVAAIGRARITRGYAVIFRRGWRCGRPRSSAGGAAGRRRRRQAPGSRPWRRRRRQHLGRRSRCSILAAAGSVAAGAAASAAAPTRSAARRSARARAADLSSEGNAGLCGHF